MNLENIVEPFNDKAAEASFDPAEIQQHKGVAIVGYIIPFLFFLPIVTGKESNFCKFHANQQLTWFIVTALLGIVEGIVSKLPLIGTLCGIVVTIAELFLMVCLVYGANRGKAVKLPFVGDMLKVF